MILRRDGEPIGVPKDFVIMDDEDQISLIKRSMELANVDPKRFPPRAVLSMISSAKSQLRGPEGFAAAANSYYEEIVHRIFVQYQGFLDRSHAVDFDDLLSKTVELMQQSLEVRTKYQDRFIHLMVDEFQDTNIAQYQIAKELAAGYRNLAVVGDPDQSIYAWRGAEVGNILRFEKDFEGAQVIRLEQNYRSTSHILGAASDLIANNQGRLGKTLWTESTAGDKVSVQGYWDGEAEAREIGEYIQTERHEGQSLNDVAVLVRAGHQTRPFEERFIQIELPYRVIGVMRFYERLEIKDAIAYLRVIAQEEDDLAFERIVNRPKRNIGVTSLQKLHVVSRSNGCSLMAAARDLIDSDELRGPTRTGLAKLISDFDRWRDQAGVERLPSLTEMVMDGSGYLDMWRNDRSVQAPGRLENLRELIGALDEFDTLDSFLEHISLVLDNAETVDGDMVNLMTLHGAKGLEFDTVYLPGWEEGLFPHQRAIDEGGLHALEEERRLAYVGLTRARHKAIVSYAANRNLFGRWNSELPSRFVGELPDKHVTRASAINTLTDPKELELDFKNIHRPDLGRRRSNWSRYATQHQNQLDQTVNSETDRTNTFKVGSRIFHQKFGYGKITAIDGNKLEVSFEKAGIKKVMANYVKPA